MRLLHLAGADHLRPVALTPRGEAFDLSVLTRVIDGRFLRDGLDVAHREVAAHTLPRVHPHDLQGRLGPPAAGIGKIVCVGLNYADHAHETGATPPSEPVLFLKAPHTIVGPQDTVLIPPGSTHTDYEVELAVVIGAPARYLPSPAVALSHVAGYAISHDVSEREYQLERGGQWDKGKNCATFNPLGPWLVTVEEVPDPQALALRTWVNGELRQDGSTANMIFDVAHLIWYISQFMPLEAGDVINTGTPAGVALARGPQAYLSPGDVVELEIDGLGRQRQRLSQAEGTVASR